MSAHLFQASSKSGIGALLTTPHCAASSGCAPMSKDQSGRYLLSSPRQAVALKAATTVLMLVLAE